MLPRVAHYMFGSNFLVFHSAQLKTTHTAHATHATLASVKRARGMEIEYWRVISGQGSRHWKGGVSRNNQIGQRDTRTAPERSVDALQGGWRLLGILLVTVAGVNKAEQSAHCQGSGPPSFNPSLITTVCTNENQAANKYDSHISVQICQSQSSIQLSKGRYSEQTWQEYFSQSDRPQHHTLSTILWELAL